MTKFDYLQHTKEKTPIDSERKNSTDKKSEQGLKYTESEVLKVKKNIVG
jgi:hypothetical protein